MLLRACVQRKKGADPDTFRDRHLMGHVLERPEDFFNGDALHVRADGFVIDRNKILRRVFLS